MPRTRTHSTRVDLPGYSLADALVLTSASKSNLQHWTKVDVIAADMMNTEGRGNHRRFSTFNLIEIELCAALNDRYSLGGRELRGAVNILRSFHIGAVAFYEEMTKVPFADSRIRVVTPGCDGSIMPGRVGLVASPERRAASARHFATSYQRWDGDPTTAATLWHELRSSPVINGGPFSWGHEAVLIIGETFATVRFDPADLLSAVDDMSITVKLPVIVSRVGQRWKALNRWGSRTPLIPW